MGDRCTTLVGFSGIIPSAIKDSSGRPNGSTHEANCRLPTSRSRSLDVATPAASSVLILAAYLVTFAGSKRHTFDMEQYSNPRITKAVAGPSVLAMFILVSCVRPLSVTNFMSSIANLHTFAPPNPSSTYDLSTAAAAYLSLKREIHESNHSVAQRQKSLDELLLPKGIAMSM